MYYKRLTMDNLAEMFEAIRVFLTGQFFYISVYLEEAGRTDWREQQCLHSIEIVDLGDAALIVVNGSKFPFGAKTFGVDGGTKIVFDGDRLILIDGFEGCKVQTIVTLEK